MTSAADDDLDLELDIPDVDTQPTPESKFYSQQTAPPAPKIENARIWLWQCLAPIASLMGTSDIKITKDGQPVTMALISRELLRHYYLMYYFPKFEPTIEGAVPCDMDKFLDMICEHSSITKTTAQAIIELGRQRG